MLTSSAMVLEGGDLAWEIQKIELKSPVFAMIVDKPLGPAFHLNTRIIRPSS